ncbi:MAG: fibronectin type III domain-containing protein, partial [bacterium]|nr:fibronectin type III domain-containing protein [bacterium]
MIETIVTFFLGLGALLNPITALEQVQTQTVLAAVASSCTDTDGGLNFFSKGTQSVPGYTYTDYCSGANLVENYCGTLSDSTRVYNSNFYVCAGGSCVNGVCPSSPSQIYPTCTDSDGGVNLAVAGTVSYTRNSATVYTASDSCSGSLNIIEQVCAKTDNGYFEHTNINRACPSGTSCSSGACKDIIAPTVPTGLSATAVSSSQINLSWAKSTDAVGVTGYRVYRNGLQIATVGIVAAYSNTGLTAGTSYSYTVAAYDAAGNVSAQSGTVSVMTLPPPDTTAPSVPTGLSGTAVSQSQINLSWSASTDAVGVTGYRVYKSGVHVATVTTGTTYSDTFLNTSTTYSYTVAAYDAAGNVSAQ